MFEANVDYTKLIDLEGGTLKVASYIEIRDSLIKMFQEIYGTDIDIDSACADGQFINAISLIFNNILQTFQYAFDNFDPATAQGKYLDILSSYNNIQRQEETKSTVQLYIRNSGNDLTPDFLTFVDRNGNSWTWYNSAQITFESGNTYLITDVVCDTKGSIIALGTPFLDDQGDPTNDLQYADFSQTSNADINRFIDNSYPNLSFWQRDDAVVGQEAESDESLRNRRNLLLGNSSVSVLEGLKGALLNTDGIEDCYIYNNVTNSTVLLDDAHSSYKPINDGTGVLPHSIYVSLRIKENLTIPESTIGQLIYKKLTPGIQTSESGETSQSKQWQVPNTVGNLYINWKQCQSITPYIKIEFLLTENFDLPNNPTTEHEASTEIEKMMVDNLQKYLNKVKINEYIQSAKLMTAVQTSDRPKNGLPTFFVSTAQVADSNTIWDNNYPMRLKYLKYTNEINNSDFKFIYNLINNKGTIIIAWENILIYIGNNPTTSINIQPEEELDFTSNHPVIWTCAPNLLGSIDSDGHFTATNNTGNCLVTATSKLDGSTKQCTVTIM